jgi:YVTN family beta-propeller protein
MLSTCSPLSAPLFWRRPRLRKKAPPLAIAFLLVVAASTCYAAGKGIAKLYVSNSEGDDITVIDLATYRVIADIQVGEQVHGLCAPSDGRRLFTTIESENNLKVIDTTTDKVVDTIPLTGRPNQCASTPNGRYVCVPVRDGNSVDIVDTAARKVVKVLPVNLPHNCYDADNDDAIFVSSMGDQEINLIDLKTMAYAKKIPVGGIPRPYAVSKDGKRLYAALSDFHGFVIATIPDQKIVARVELPPAPPLACRLEPHTPTHGIELSPDGKELWVTSLADSGVYVYDIATNHLSTEIHIGKCPNWITFSPDGRYGAVSNSGSDDSSIIDTRTRREVARVKVGKGPKRLLAVTVP